LAIFAIVQSLPSIYFSRNAAKILALLVLAEDLPAIDLVPACSATRIVITLNAGRNTNSIQEDWSLASQPAELFPSYMLVIIGIISLWSRGVNRRPMFLSPTNAPKTLISKPVLKSF
jgi:hypothetical protein